MNRSTGLGREPFWYKDAIIYEAHVRAFMDSNADGIGDFPGLTQKLDYLQELGVTAIWLLPFYPSPLKDDGYDIADYTAINPIYGTLRDFRTFLHEAHRRRLRVITELVLNHTSDQHPWFQRSRRAPRGSAWRNFYVWSDSPEKYKEARIIFHDFETSNWTWDPVAQAYYWHRFYSHQPDLNYDNPQVHKKVMRVLDFWLDQGVDGFRLDAVPYLYEREGTSCENLPECHEFLKKLRRHIDDRYEDRMLLAEANQWPEEAVAYFGSGTGDECHMAFHFPLMPRIFMSVRMEDRMPVEDILEQTPPIPQSSHWALFLRNHDELTLEMVTDEERDYMYRVYANDTKARINLGIRRRLAPLLGKDRKRIELLHLLLFSLPGTPVLYYGDEIGMGDNVFLGDRNGVRTPMQWSSDKNAGFSRASPQALYLPITLDPEFHYEAVNVETEQRNPHSLWWWMKRVLALRKRYQAFGRGDYKFIKPENRKILAFVRRYEAETILVIANLSRYTQPVHLDLAAFQNTVPIELFGHTTFPPITREPYFLTLNPHACLWLSLEPIRAPTAPAPTGAWPTLEAGQDWLSILQDERRGRLETCLAGHLKRLPWFPSREREIKLVHVQDTVPMPMAAEPLVMLLLQVEYRDGDPEEFLLPLSLATGELAARLPRESPQLVLARIQLANQPNPGLLYDASGDKVFCAEIFEAIARRRSYESEAGELSGVNLGLRRNGQCANGAANGPAGETHSGAKKPHKTGNSEGSLEPTVRHWEGTTSIVFGQDYRLKLYRRLEAGANPELELGRFLSERQFQHTLPVAGALRYQTGKRDPIILGILTRYLPHAKNAWFYTLDALGRYFERAGSAPAGSQPAVLSGQSLIAWAATEPPPAAVGAIGTYLEAARLLGRRAGEFHLALASDPENSNFAPEPFTPFYQRALYQSMRNTAVDNLRTLRVCRAQIPASIVPLADQVTAQEGRILDRLRAVHLTRMSAQRIRCHGDFHLGRVLATGKDFVIIDFESVPRRSLGERRIKRPATHDLAVLIRSFDYATHAALDQQVEQGMLDPGGLQHMGPWAEAWYGWVSAVFLQAYLEKLHASDLLPDQGAHLEILLESHLLERALSEIHYQLWHKPAWLEIPLRRILRLLELQPEVTLSSQKHPS